MIKTLSHYTDKGRIERLELLVGSGQEVITESTTKTVGEGKDFETLHLAFRWIENITQPGGFVILSIDDGVHVLGGEGEFDEDWWTYYAFNEKHLYIESASGNKDNCIITLNSYDDDDNYPAIIQSQYCDIYFKNVTIDIAAAGYPYPINVDFGYFTMTTMQLIDVDFKNCAGIYTQNQSYILGMRLTIDGCDKGIWNTNSTFDLRSGITIQNCNEGIYVYRSGKCIADSGNITFTNNTADTNIPLNEIQYDGSYISDGTGALSFKA